MNNPSPLKSILIYGSFLGGSLALIRFIESGYHLKLITVEHYVGILVIGFLFVGIVFGLRLNRPPVTENTGGKLRQDPGAGMEERLSGRERQVFDLLCRGLSNREISDSLYISLPTTKTHISNIYAKLGVKNRAEALVKARDEGMIV